MILIRFVLDAVQPNTVQKYTLAEANLQERAHEPTRIIK